MFLIQHSFFFLALPLVLTAGLLAQAAADASPEPTARDIVSRAMDKQFPGNSVSEITMTLINERGTERTRKLLTKRKEGEKGEGKILAVFRYPPDVKGTSFLVWEHPGRSNDVFLYLPALRKVRRIASDQRNQSFMGSDFSYADMEGLDADDARHRFLPEETVDGEPCWVIESVPLPRSESEYGRLVTWVCKKDFVPHRTRFFDQDGELYKVLDVQRTDTVDDRLLPVHLTMQTVPEEHKTEIVIEEIRLNQSLRDREFTRRAMRRR